MTESTTPPYYPETQLQHHGIPPHDWTNPGCYALNLTTPPTERDFMTRWRKHYDVNPPEALLAGITDGVPFVYVGATGNLRDRLHDHATGSHRQSSILTVLPATGVAAVWIEESASLAFERERGHAYSYRDGHPGVVVLCNGEVV